MYSEKSGIPPVEVNEQPGPSAPPTYQQSEFQRSANPQPANQQQPLNPQAGFAQIGHQQQQYNQQPGYAQNAYQQSGYPMPMQPGYQNHTYGAVTPQPVYMTPMPQMIAPQPVYMAQMPQVAPQQATTSSTSVKVDVGGVTGNGTCPHCRRGFPMETYTFCGILCAILFFPIGLICLIAMKTRRCPVCGLNS